MELTDKQVEDRTRRYCQQYEQPIYRNPKPCAGVLVVDERECVLLVKRTEPPAPGTWSIPAGYLEADEPPRQAAVRELYVEANVPYTKTTLRCLRRHLYAIQTGNTYLWLSTWHRGRQQQRLLSLDQMQMTLNSIVFPNWNRIEEISNQGRKGSSQPS